MAKDGRVTSTSAAEFDMPKLPNLAAGDGFTIELWISMRDLSSQQIILDCRKDNGKGVALTTTEVGTLRLDLNDGRHKYYWNCDPGLLRVDKLHHVVFIVDGGPKIVSVLVDGILCDGGAYRQYGWGRFTKHLGDVNGMDRVRIAPAFKGALKSLRIYNRYLRTSEAIGNFHAGS